MRRAIIQPSAQSVSERPVPASATPRAAHDGALVLSARQLARIEMYARHAYPQECCGVLVGVRHGDRIDVSSAHSTANCVRGGKRDRYEIDSAEILRLDRLSADHGCEIVGFYHSHPDHPAAPSPRDAAAAWPHYVYVIIGVDAAGRTQARAWTYDSEQGTFHEKRVELESGEAPPHGNGPAGAAD